MLDNVHHHLVDHNFLVAKALRTAAAAALHIADALALRIVVAAFDAVFVAADYAYLHSVCP